MTANKLKKKDLNELFNKVDVRNLDKKVLYSIKRVLNNEVECSIRNEGIDKHLTPRNVVCFNNVLECLNRNEIEVAWWELTDIISFNKDEDYISVDEVVLLNIGLGLIIEKL